MTEQATLNDLQEQRQKKAAEMREYFDANESAWNDDHQAKWETINADYTGIKDSIDAANRNIEQRKAAEAALLEAEGAIKGRKTPPPTDPRVGRDNGVIVNEDDDNERWIRNPWAAATSGWIKASFDEGQGPDADEIAAAKHVGIRLGSKRLTSPLLSTNEFRKLQRAGGMVNGRYQNDYYKNALTTQTGSTGGFTVGETFMDSLEQAVLFSGQMLQAAEIIRTSTGEPMHWPTADDTSNTGTILPENIAAAEADPDFGEVMWQAYKFSSKFVKVPFELLEDSLFNMPQVLGEMLGTRIGRKMNAVFTTGIGGSEPFGIITQATVGKTAASATAIVYDELLDLEHSIDPLLRMGSSYMFHDNILLALRKLKDSEGRYFWQAGSNTGAPDTLNTYPYWINNDMASAIITTAKTILFGRLSAYKIRMVGSARTIRLVERFRDNDQDGFITFERADGNLLDPGDNPVKVLQQA